MTPERTTPKTYRLPIEQLTERQVQQRSHVERAAVSRISAASSTLALGFGIGAIICILLRAAAHAGWL